MRKMVIRKLSPGEYAVDERQPGTGTVTHRHGDGAVQLNNRGWLCAEKDIVQPDDFPPVRGSRTWSFGVNCSYGRLQCVGPEPVGHERTFNERCSFLDEFLPKALCDALVRFRSCSSPS